MSVTTGLKTKRKRKPYPKIIIVGKMQSGKTTAANYLVDNYKYKKASLASPIKDIVINIDSLDNAKLLKYFITPYYKLSKEQRLIFFEILDATRNLPSEFPKPRKRLQFLGTDGVRSRIDNNFWLKVFASKWENERRVVVDDCRFINEYEYFDGLGYNNLKIKVSQQTQNERLHKLYNGAYDPKILEHPSETEQPLIMRRYPENIITNNGSLDDYYSKIDEWITKIRL